MSQDNSFSYMFLSRLHSDCKYFLDMGDGSVKVLYHNSVEEHINDMKKRWNELPTDGKPEWLTFEEIERLEKEMINKK